MKDRGTRGPSQYGKPASVQAAGGQSYSLNFQGLRDVPPEHLTGVCYAEGLGLSGYKPHVAA
jgi:hypothetical protein